MWCCIVLGNKVLNSLTVEQSKNLDVALSILIADIEPELVELVRRCVAGIEPYVTALGLTKLCTISLGDEWAGDGKSLSPYRI